MKKLFLFGLIALFTIVACQQNEELVNEEEITIEVANKAASKIIYSNKMSKQGTITFIIPALPGGDAVEMKKITCLIETLNASLVSIEIVGSFSQQTHVTILDKSNGVTRGNEDGGTDYDPIDNETYQEQENNNLNQYEQGTIITESDIILAAQYCGIQINTVLIL